MAMKGYFKKLPNGVLAPDNAETAEWLRMKVKTGAVVSAEFKQPRNYKFLAKTMVLFDLCYGYFKDSVQPLGLEYRGVKAVPSFDRFRKDLTILAGHYDATYDIRGRVKVEAKSLSFASCTEEEAERIYSDVINAALKHVVSVGFNEEQLRQAVDDILRFA